MEELLADPSVDAVVVATLPNLHEQHVVAAARAGKHVFVEKPMALSTESCDRMIEAARQGGVTLMVGQVLRLIEPFQSIIRWTREGRFGRPVHVLVQRLGATFGRGSWRASLATAGGYLFEVGAHELDFMRCLCGRAAEVYAVRQKARAEEHEMEDAVSLLVRFASGATGRYDGGTAWGRSQYELALCFEEATLLSGTAWDTAALAAFGAGPEPKQIPLEGFETENGVVRQMRGWIESLRGGGPVPVPGEEGREAVRLAETAYRSAETRQVEALTGPAS